MVKHTITCLPPLLQPTEARLSRALGSQAGTSPLAMGQGWSSTSTSKGFHRPRDTSAENHQQPLVSDTVR